MDREPSVVEGSPWTAFWRATARAARDEPARTAPADGGTAAPAASVVQERLWFLDRLSPGHPRWNTGFALRLEGRLDHRRLRAAVDELARRHGSLRTRFEAIDGLPRPVIDREPRWELETVDLRPLGFREREPAARREARATLVRGFDLVRGPLVACRLIQLDDELHVLALALHHIVSDAWSTRVLRRDLASAYSGRPLPGASAVYDDWTRQRSAPSATERELDYWRERLRDASPLELPPDHDRPDRDCWEAVGGRAGLPAAERRMVATLARGAGVTFPATLLAVVGVLLCRWSGQSDIIVGLPWSSRPPLLRDEVGVFTETVVVRLEIDVQQPAAVLLQSTRDAALAAFAHRHVGFDRLVELAPPRRDAAQNPLFEAMLVADTYGGPAPTFAGLRAEPFQVERGTLTCDAAFAARDDGHRIELALDLRADRFDASTPDRVLARLRRLLDGMAADPTAPCGRIPLMTPAERQRLLRRAAVPGGQRLSSMPVHRRFEHQAARTPTAIAVVEDGYELRYGDLDRRANHVAERLTALGAGPRQIVPLLTRGGADCVLGMLAILKAGAAFAPLDANWPAHRLEQALATVGSGVVMCDSVAGTRNPGSPVAMLRADARTGPASEAPPETAPDLEDMMYVMFTSGTTGRPKGVVVPHRGIANRFAWMDAEFGDDAAKVALQTTPHVYDSAVWQLLWPLTGGGRTVPRPRGFSHTAPELLDLIERHGVTIVDFVPSLLRDIMPELLSGEDTRRALRSLRRIVIGGEEIDAAAAHSLAAALPDARVSNLYGPTEASIGCVHRELVVRPDRSVPIGKPIVNVRAIVVDDEGAPAPDGFAGELWLGGACLAGGYLGDPEATRAAFVPDPFGRTPGGRLFRTGDRAHVRADGDLGYLGRLDDRFNLRGQLVDPRGIERVLLEHPDIRDVAITAVGPRAGPVLAAAVVPVVGASVDARDVRSFLLGRLPAHLVPVTVGIVDELPRLGSGKLNRRAVADALATATEPAPARPAPPSASPYEPLVSEIWRTVLGGPAPRADEDFFMAGGHSLAAVRMIARLHDAAGVELTLQTFFAHPTPRALALALARAPAADSGERIYPGPPGPAPLSSSQRRLWFLEQLEPGNAIYHLHASRRLTGPLDVAALERSLNSLLERHESLQTVFEEEADGEPLQSIREPSPMELAMADLTRLAPGERERTARDLLAADTGHPFDLRTGPMLRARLVAMGLDDHVLLLTVHHIACDGRSLQLLTRELGELYAADLAGRAPRLAPPTLTYRDFSRRERVQLSEGRLAADLRFWSRTLASAPSIALPTVRERPSSASYSGHTHLFSLAPPLTERLRTLARDASTTLFTTLLAGVEVLLSRYGRTQDVLVGVPVAGRLDSGIEEVVGDFSNTVVMRTDLTGCETFLDVLARAHETALAAQAHQRAPFEAVVAELRPARHLSRNPIFQVLLGFHDQGDAEWRLPGVEDRRFPFDPGVARVDLAFDFTDGGAGDLHCALTCSRDLFDADAGPSIAGHLRTLLTAVATAPDGRLRHHALLDQTQTHRRLCRRNEPIVDVGQPDSIAGRFEEQVARAPDAIAVVYGDCRVTYGELDLRSRALAARLAALGVGTGAPVAVCVAPSIELIVSMLGVLYAGGAYVALDPSHPIARLADQLEDSAARVLVGGGSPAEALAGQSVALVDVAAGGSAGDEQPPPERHAGELAYITYTSGSTGRPKGVAVTQRGVLALVEASAGPMGFNDRDIWSMLHSCAFDLSGYEVWGSLLNGGQLVIVPPHIRRMPDELLELLRDEGVTVVCQTPSALGELLEAAEERAIDGPAWAPRVIVCGGERMPVAHARRALALEWPLWNFYGPTEATIWVSAHRVRNEDLVHSSVPLGLPLAHADVHVLDHDWQLAADGAIGEIHIGGAALARGYWRRPELTRERFATAPQGPCEGQRLFRTGDLGRPLGDGRILFCGRADRQVKVRGHRVQLEEVEAALLAHPRIAAAAVATLEREEHSLTLAAAVVVIRGAPLGAPELRRFLHARLPAYMVPSSISFAQNLRLSPSAKLDLPAALHEDDDRGAAPRGASERFVACVWQELLGAPRLGRHDDFFDEGGDSLLAARAVARLRSELGVALSLRALFEAPTVAGLAARIEALRATTSAR